MEQKVTLKTWEAANVGFWKDAPYILLSDSFLYKEEKVILFQHNIIDAEMNVETFRFWTHFFSQKDLKRMMKKQGFNTIQFIDDILPKEDKWNGDSVIFSIVKK